MSYQVLARKWRPRKFSELVGQEHVVTAISNALDNNRLHHAYLFTGTRGVGKTTIARIFSKSLNCEQGMSANPCGQCPTCVEIEQGNYVDLLEIDAASRTKVEDTRELLDNVQYKPTRGEYKVYLIDEVHMLSKHSFNALLKTLEEPPPHVKFLLATTDPQKLPVTILSRCLQFNLKALSRDQIATQLAHILGQEHLEFDKEALVSLARAAQGSMRDALSLTDQAIAQGNGQVSSAVVTDMLGLMDKGQVLRLVHSVVTKQHQAMVEQVEALAVTAPDFEQILSEMLSLLHQVALTQMVPDACKLETTSARAIYELAKACQPEHIQLMYQLALNGKKDIKFAPDARTGLEMTLLRMLAFSPANIEVSPDSLSALGEAQPAHALPAAGSSAPTVAEKPVTQKSGEKAASASHTAAVGQEEDDPVGHGLREEQDDILRQADQLRGDNVSEQHPSMASSPEKTQVDPQQQAPMQPEETGQGYDAADFEQHAPAPEFDTEQAPQGFEQAPYQGENEYGYADATPPEAEQAAAGQPDVPDEAATPAAPQSGSAPSTTETLLALQQQLRGNSQSDESEGTDAGKKPATEGLSEPTASEQAAPWTPPTRPKPVNEANVCEQQNDPVSDPVTSEIMPAEVSEDHHQGVNAPNVTAEAPAPGFASSSVPAEERPPWEASEQTTPASNEDIQSMPEMASEPFVTSDPTFEAVEVAVDITHDAPSIESVTKSGSSDEGGIGLQSPDDDFFDPNAHLYEEVDVPVDIPVSAFTQAGEKVIYARQLNDWADLIDKMNITALTKQLALHSSFEMRDNQVTLTLPQEKEHLVSDSAIKQLQHALQETLAREIALNIELRMPSNTPFAVQKKINDVRQEHAVHVVKSDEKIVTLCNVFSAGVVEDSIKPR